LNAYLKQAIKTFGVGGYYFIIMKHIQTLFEKYNDLSGAISLYNPNTDEEYSRAYGYSNINEQIKNSLSTKFGMASGSKIFTAIAILQLVEKGYLALESKANDFLTNYRVDDSIKILHLLTHTSGIPDYFDEETMTDYEALWRNIPNYTILKPEDFFPLFIYHPNKFKPGYKFSYSNSGFVLLSYILEQVGKESFPNYIKKNIFDKCGMKNTGYFRFDQLPKDSATGYIFDEILNNYRSNIYSLPIVGGGDGGCYSCGNDMNIFWNGLMDGKLLNTTSLEELFKVRQDNDDEDDYGLGVWISKFNKNIFYVQGSDPGVKFFSYFNVNTRANFNVYTNINYHLSNIISDFLEFVI
jgi:CubicO group peptidase (beta-lactamase class C family)